MLTNVASKTPLYFPMGDQAIVIQFEHVISLETNKRVHTTAHLIETREIRGITQLIPAFNNLTVCYDPVLIGFGELITELKKLEEYDLEQVEIQSKTLHIPVVFGGRYGPDLEEIANHAKLTIEEVVALLQSKRYFTYMIGFIAGYPYCGDIDSRLSLPRRANPRVKVEKGTIQIVNNLTGIFTMTAPSGWHIVGWTPMEIFNPKSDPPSLLQAGDYIQYVPVSEEEVQQWDQDSQKAWDQKWNM
ncbi:5-oxoprolinase subunit PxpB [Sporosarcina soli]|uniref:5-oxoprolinase subunit PxpB n=1 Tax=Sporosarcina soli TaxID=334736 RepID=A0ABW0TMT7_9BACL